MFDKVKEKLNTSQSATDKAQDVSTSPIMPIPLDEPRFLAYADGKWHKVTPKTMFILKMLNSNPGQAFTGEELKEFKGSDERPDRIIQRLPKPIRKRITNTPQHGYHLI
jgi:DNA-binding response OmpR family regulator